MARCESDGQEVRAITAPATAGFSLVETVFAVALLLVVLTATADSLLNFYAALTVQEQRIVAIQQNISVLNEMRAERDSNPYDFPEPILLRWPQGTVIEDDPNTPITERITSLPEQTITINYVNEDGTPASVDNTTNPLRVQVTSTWTDVRGREATALLVSVLTDG